MSGDGCKCFSENSWPQQSPQWPWQEQMTSAKQLAWLHMDDKSWQEWFLQLDNGSHVYCTTRQYMHSVKYWYILHFYIIWLYSQCHADFLLIIAFLLQDVLKPVDRLRNTNKNKTQRAQGRAQIITGGRKTSMRRVCYNIQYLAEVQTPLGTQYFQVHLYSSVKTWKVAGGFYFDEPLDKTHGHDIAAGRRRCWLFAT